MWARRPDEEGNQAEQTVDDSHQHISRALHHLQVTLLLCGLSPGKGTGTKRTISWIYTIFAMCILLGSACRLYTPILVIDVRRLSNPVFILYLVATLWVTLFSSTALIFIVGHVKGTVGNLHTRITHLAGSTSQLRLPTVQRQVLVAIVIYFVLVVSNTSVLVYISINSGVFEVTIMYPVSDWNIGVKLLIFLGFLYTTAVWLIPSLYSAVIVTMLRVMFKEHRQQLEKVSGDRSLTLEILEVSRQRFNDLCDLVGDADSLLGPVNGATYTLNVGQLLLLLYSGIFTDPSRYGGLSHNTWLLIVIIWTFVCLVFLVVPSILGTCLNCTVSHF